MERYKLIAFISFLSLIFSSTALALVFYTLNITLTMKTVGLYEYTTKGALEPPDTTHLLSFEWIEVNGFTEPNEDSSVRFQIYNSEYVTHWFHYRIEIFEGTTKVQTIVKDSGEKSIGGHYTYTSPLHSFVSPSEYGSYEVRVTIFKISE